MVILAVVALVVDLAARPGAHATTAVTAPLMKLSVLKYSSTAVDLASICFANAKDGWAVGTRLDKHRNAVGGVLLTTHDGGAAWSAKTIEGVRYPTAIALANSRDVWVVGYTESGSIIVGTTNGGVTWREQYAGKPFALTDVVFSDASHGWAVGTTSGWSRGYVLITSDGGAKWKTQPVPGAGGLSAVSFASSTCGWVIGSNGIYATTDGGTTWKLQYRSATLSFSGIAFASTADGWAVGSDLKMNADTIIATTDGGASWTVQSDRAYSRIASALGGLEEVAALDSRHAWAVGNGGVILVTANGGLTWKQQTAATTADLCSLAFSDEQHAWIVGNRFSDLPAGGAHYVGSMILVTRDGGATWTKQK